MTTLDPKALNAAKQTFGDALSWGADPQDALSSALSAFVDALSSLPAQAVGVKLEWESIDSTSMWANCKPFWLQYRVALQADRMKRLTTEWLGNRTETIGTFAEWDEAKEAAGADLSRRLSALAPSQPAAVGVTDEMVEAANAAYVAVQTLRDAIVDGAVVTDGMVERARAAHGAIFQEILQERTIDALAPERQEANDKRMMRAALEAALRSTP